MVLLGDSLYCCFARLSGLCLVIAYAVALLDSVVLLGDRPLGCSLTCFLFYLFTFLLFYPFTFKKCATY